MKETAERLMDVAEAHMRGAGYGGFSFRDLAAEIGITASLQGDFSEAHGAEHALARIQPFYARPVTVAAAGWSP